MANFEGKLNLNVETSEIEVEGKFKLTEEELDKVAGGVEVQSWWKVVHPANSCGSWQKADNPGFWAVFYGGGSEPQTCAYCSHLTVASGKNYCTLED